MPAKKEIKPALNIRDFPPDLMDRLKEDSKERNMRLREWVIYLLDIRQPARNIGTILDPEIRAVLHLPPAIAEKVTTASQLQQPATSEEGHPPGSAVRRCGRCDSICIPWGPGQVRCRTCAMNWPA